MDRIDGMRTFVAVAEGGSFAAASKRLGMTNKLVSKYIAALEADRKMRLLFRTTRSMSLTPEGRTFLEGCRRVLGELEALDASLDASAGLTGPLRVAAPLAFGDSVVAPAVDAFMDANPHVTVELDLGDRHVDLAQGGFDLAVRFGVLKDSSLISRKLGETRTLVIAAPSYLERYGEPTNPNELVDHICIRDANNPDPNRWAFQVEGQRMQVAVSGPFIANSPLACLVPTRSGKGIYICPDVFLENDLADGTLVRLLKEFQTRVIPIQAVQLPSTYQNPKTTAFVRFLRERMIAVR